MLLYKSKTWGKTAFPQYKGLCWLSLLGSKMLEFMIVQSSTLPNGRHEEQKQRTENILPVVCCARGADDEQFSVPQAGLGTGLGLVTEMIKTRAWIP